MTQITQNIYRRKSAGRPKSLTEQEEVDIKVAHMNGAVPARLAEKYNVSAATISNLLNNKTTSVRSFCEYTDKQEAEKKEAVKKLLTAVMNLADSNPTELISILKELDNA